MQLLVVSARVCIVTLLVFYLSKSRDALLVEQM